MDDFLSRTTNKTSLIASLVSEWKSTQHRGQHENVLYASIREVCFKITSEECVQVPCLQRNEEEADGCLLLHATHAANDGCQAVVICSEDTDVFIMLLAFHDAIGVPLFQKCSTKIRKLKSYRHQKVGSGVGISVCQALIGMHAFTGRDTVSAFAGKG